MSGESGHPCLIANRRGKTFKLLPSSMMLTVGLSHMDFIMLRYVLYMPNLLSFLNHKCILGFVNCFFLHLLR